MLLCLPWKASQLIIQVHEGRPEPAVWTPRISALCRAGSSMPPAWHPEELPCSTMPGSM